ncbi:unnamed protein product [Sphagnum balticum]
MHGDNAAAAPQVKGAVLSNGGAAKKKLQQQQQSTQVVGPWVSKVRPSAAPAAQLHCDGELGCSGGEAALCGHVVTLATIRLVYGSSDVLGIQFAECIVVWTVL